MVDCRLIYPGSVFYGEGSAIKAGINSNKFWIGKFLSSTRYLSDSSTNCCHYMSWVQCSVLLYVEQFIMMQVTQKCQNVFHF